MLRAWALRPVAASLLAGAFLGGRERAAKRHQWRRDLDACVAPLDGVLLPAVRLDEHVLGLFVRREDHGDVSLQLCVGVARGQRARLIPVEQADGVLGRPRREVDVVEDDAVAHAADALEVVLAANHQRVLEVGLGEGRLACGGRAARR